MKFEPSSLTVAENVGSGSVKVVLNHPPSGTVGVTITSNNTEVVKIDDTNSTIDGYQNTLIFSPFDWSEPQTVNLTIFDDSDDNEENLSTTLSAVSSDGSYISAFLAVTLVDDDFVPAELTTVRAVAGDKKIFVTWDRPVDDPTVTGYEIRQYLSRDASSSLISIDGWNNDSYMATGLLNDSGYGYTVRAVNTVGKGPVAIATGIYDSVVYLFEFKHYYYIERFALWCFSG